MSNAICSLSEISILHAVEWDIQKSDQHILEQKTATVPIFDDLFGDSLGTGVSASEHKNDDDPFADVSFHTNDDKEHVTDIFLE
ncbi:Protein MODIFIED TRANSPORT TO THE VACUOLE 1 [Camellia lanceoleosa]|uniref:Protein MODIFIED TRANSPORT TO THE VACUOLE 1 n=1 Tax=Camellia lanceoleosa TaxID=1840588 RepID=A0ACC0HA15_9ERIC|nr:Protein MODIFIED TRANSPORT TO THE VACUOLE 1 [Camellia lanceoleosa]